RCDPRCEGDASGAPAFSPGEGILEDRSLRGRHTECPRAGKESIRRRLASEPLALGHHTVDAGLEEPLYSGGDQNVAGVCARRDYGTSQARVACCLEVPHRSLVDLYAPLADHLQDKLVLAVAQPADGIGTRRGLGTAFGQL